MQTIPQHIKTKLGTLCVTFDNSPDYPGIWIGLEHDGQRLDFIKIEVDQVNPDEPVLNICEWAFDPEKFWDEAAHMTKVTREQIDSLKED